MASERFRSEDDRVVLTRRIGNAEYLSQPIDALSVEDLTIFKLRLSLTHCWSPRDEPAVFR